MHPRGLCPVLDGGECRHQGTRQYKHSPWFAEMMGKRRARFEREELYCLILHLLEDNECHGYEIMQQIEEWTDGTYRPSPGVLYPALRTMEKSKLILSTAQGRRNVYAITEKGKAELGAKRSLLEDIHEDIGQRLSPEFEMFFENAHEDISGMFRAVSRAFRNGRVDPTKINAILERIRRTAEEVAAIVKE